MSNEAEHRAAADRFRAIVAAHPTAMQQMQKISAELNTTILDATQSGHVRLSFETGERFMNTFGGLQGGIIAALIDEACSYAVTSIVGAHCFLGTVDLRTTLLEKVRPGRVEGIARTLKVTKRAVFSDAELFVANRLVASGSATILIDFGRPVRVAPGREPA